MDYNCVCLYASLRGTEVFLMWVMYTTFLWATEEAAVSEGGIHFTPSQCSRSLPWFSCLLLCLSWDRGWQLLMCVGHVFWDVCVCPGRCGLQCGPPFKCHWSQSLPPDYPTFPHHHTSSPPPTPVLELFCPIYYPIYLPNTWICTTLTPFLHSLNTHVYICFSFLNPVT